jgi:MYXO-CTERM domain-containing protein
LGATKGYTRKEQRGKHGRAATVGTPKWYIILFERSSGGFKVMTSQAARQQQRLPVVVAVLFFVGMAPSVLAGPITIFSTFGPGNTTGTTQNLEIGGSFQNEFADSFTPSATYTLNSITISAEFIGGTTDQLTVFLASGATQPGAPIESFSLTGLPSTFPGTVETVTSVLNPTLLAGTTYWVVLAASNPANTSDGWAEGLVSYPGEVFLGTDTNFPNWTINTAEGNVGPGGAFSVAATPTPEPATGALSLGALVLLGLVVRRRHA